MIKIEVTAQLDVFDLFLQEAEAEIARAVAATAFFLEGEAKKRAPVDTGALRNSIFTITWKTSGAANAFATAVAAQQGVKFGPIPPAPTSPLDALVVCGVEYGIFVEYGAFHIRGNTQRLGSRAGRIGVEMEPGVFATFTPGYRFMNDAADAARPVLHKACQRALKLAARRRGMDGR